MISVLTAMAAATLMRVSDDFDVAGLKAYLAGAAKSEGEEYDPASIELRGVSANPLMGQRWYCGEIAGTLRTGQTTAFRGFVVNVTRPQFFFQPVAGAKDQRTFELEAAEYLAARKSWC